MSLVRETVCYGDAPLVRWPKAPVKPDPDAKDWRFNPHHGRGENDIGHCQKIGLAPTLGTVRKKASCGTTTLVKGDKSVFPVPRPTGFRHIGLPHWSRR